MTKMVGRQLRLESTPISYEGSRHYSCVVHQKMQRTTRSHEACSERINGSRVAQIESLELNALKAGQRLSRLVRSSRWNDYRCARHRQCARRFQSDTHISTRYDGDGFIQPTAVNHFSRGRVEAVTGMYRLLFGFHGFSPLQNFVMNATRLPQLMCQ